MVSNLVDRGGAGMDGRFVEADADKCPDQRVSSGFLEVRNPPAICHVSLSLKRGSAVPLSTITL
jgi:hypothetical protein